MKIPGLELAAVVFAGVAAIAATVQSYAAVTSFDELVSNNVNDAKISECRRLIASIEKLDAELGILKIIAANEKERVLADGAYVNTSSAPFEAARPLLLAVSELHTSLQMSSVLFSGQDQADALLYDLILSIELSSPYAGISKSVNGGDFEGDSSANIASITKSIDGYQSLRNRLSQIRPMASRECAAQVFEERNAT